MGFVDVVKQALAADQGFNLFWSRYHKRVAKQAALKAWQQLAPTPELVTTILGALEWQFQQPRWTEQGHRFAPHPATYLRGHRWEDERPPEATPPRMTAAAARVLETLKDHR